MGDEKTFVFWNFVKDLNKINEVISENKIWDRDDGWEGLTCADQIISISWNANHGCYMVFWKVKMKE